LIVITEFITKWINILSVYLCVRTCVCARVCNVHLGTWYFIKILMRDAMPFFIKYTHYVRKNLIIFLIILKLRYNLPLIYKLFYRLNISVGNYIDNIREQSCYLFACHAILLHFRDFRRSNCTILIVQAFFFFHSINTICILR